MIELSFVPHDEPAREGRAGESFPAPAVSASDGQVAAAPPAPVAPVPVDEFTLVRELRLMADALERGAIRMIERRHTSLGEHQFLDLHFVAGDPMDERCAARARRIAVENRWPIKEGTIDGR